MNRLVANEVRSAINDQLNKPNKPSAFVSFTPKDVKFGISSRHFFADVVASRGNKPEFQIGFMRTF